MSIHLTSLWMSTPLCEMWETVKWRTAWLNSLNWAIFCCTQAAHMESSEASYCPVLMTCIDWSCYYLTALQPSPHMPHDTQCILTKFLLVALWTQRTFVRGKGKKRNNLTWAIMSKCRQYPAANLNLKAHETSHVCFQCSVRYFRSPAALLLSHFWEVQ